MDDTLIRTVGTKRIPIPSTINKIISLFDGNCLLYCWSSGGADYAHEIASELDIESYFAGFLPKPEIMIDDQEPSQWATLRIMHPNSLLSE